VIALKCQIDPPHPDAAPPCLVDQHRLTGFIFDQIRLVHECMRMSSNDEINILGVLSKNDIRDFIVLVSVSKV
jgi:hypothetical protein